MVLLGVVNGDPLGGRRCTNSFGSVVLGDQVLITVDGDYGELSAVSVSFFAE